MNLKFKKDTVKGKGVDSVGLFTIDGRVWNNGENSEWTKQYIGAHAVQYKTTSSSINKVEGIWCIPQYGMSDTFVIEKAYDESSGDSE